MKDVMVTRKTTESLMQIKLGFEGLAPDYRAKIDTGITFLNHMIEHIAWRSGVNVETTVKLDRFALSHVVCEDLGITLGKAVAKAVEDGLNDGVPGYGYAIGIIDEAKADAAISFESRALFDFTSVVDIPHDTEGMNSEDLETFLEGFAQGAQCTLHVDIQKGRNGHHIWEAVFRAVGIALGMALSPDPARKGRTSGVAGTVEFTVK
ncbi:MAG: hypothetical protein E7409_00845 [Ruminococcaceae bacterium]|nr:hypothetical protein [Oscillospiraceae bacterium]